MDHFVDVAYGTLIKHKEELAGDMVNVIRIANCTIIVMADGLGSGVKANILATLTSKIAGTMLKEGADLYETVDTIANTLPVCKVRNIAYSTFTIIKVYDNGETYIAEYDNPSIFIMRKGESLCTEKRLLHINGRKIIESNIKLEDGDILTAVSDGVIHAGLGDLLNLGWQWEDVENYLKKKSREDLSAQSFAKDLLEVCWDLYNKRPGDDATVVTIKLRQPSYLNIFIGPPKNKDEDRYAMKKFMECEGKKIICGGTTANIAERELNRELRVNLEFIDKDIPPIAEMDGIDLITEGVLTLNKVLRKIKEYVKPFSQENDCTVNFNGKDGVSILGKLLIEECTHLNLWVGRAVNPAHETIDFPSDFSLKLEVIEQLCDVMRKMGKKITIKYL